jgi:hypothetical protein
MKQFVLLMFVLALWSGAAFGQGVIVSQVSSDPDGLNAGEAWVVADPRDPQNKTFVVIWLVTNTDLPPSAAGTGYCGIGRSTDGGQTWSISKAPYQSNILPNTVPICGDPAGGVMPDGSIVFTGVQLGSPNEFVQSISSFDGGQTWTPPSEVFGASQTLAAALANQSVPDLGPGRQWLAVDPITGEVSVQSQVDAPTTGRQLTVSTDRGASWSTPRNVGSTSLGPIGAAFGVVAGVYTSGSNRIFQTSTDHGMTWVRNVMPVGTGTGGGTTAADPTTRGRFAVLLSRGSNLEVWITTDAGRTAASWTQAKVFTPESGDSFVHPWIAFSPTGALGVRWRSRNPNGSFDVDGVVSRDGGTTFDAPVRLTAARGPAPNPPPGPGFTGDDCACNLHLTDSTLVTTWADTTTSSSNPTGNRELWFGSFDY